VSNPEGGRKANYPYNHTATREKISNVIEDAVKYPKKYIGCPLCFGRGWIGNSMDDEGYVCPECKGDRIVLSLLGKELERGDK